jgi:riboflavin synthase
MFTGIVEQTGVVAALIKTSPVARLALSAGRFFDDLKTGDSLAVSGVCLTVSQARKGFAEFELSPESLKRTTLGNLKISDKVNLEKALPLTGRLGGHLVSGHIDGVGEIKNKLSAAGSQELFLSVPSEILRYLVPRGSIAVDGVSLTVVDFRDGLLQVMIIPHTAKTSTMGEAQIGDQVNIEVDMLSKYIERHLKGEPKGVTEEMMLRVGFLPLGWMDN